MYVIPSDPEQLRQAMIKYHEAGADRAEADMGYMATTQKAKEYERACMNTHRTMVDFWKHVHIGGIPPLSSKPKETSVENDTTN